MSPSIGQVALCSRWPMSPSCTVSWLLDPGAPDMSLVWVVYALLLLLRLGCCWQVRSRIDSQADWLWGSAMTTVFELCAKAEPMEWDSPIPWSCHNNLLVVPLVELIGWCSIVVWSQPPVVLVLRSFQRGSGQVKVSHFLWLAWGYLVGDTKQSVVGSYLCWPEGLWEMSCCEPRPAVLSIGSGAAQQNAWNTPRPAAICWLPVRFSC